MWPLSEEQLERLQADARELLTTFGVNFVINVGVVLLERTESEQTGEETKNWRLSRRPWDSVQRLSTFSGTCYMKKGPGPGAFGNLKERFLVERQDYKIDVYRSRLDYTAGEQPRRTISPAGYRMTEDTASYYSCELAKLAEPLGMTGDEQLLLTNFPSHSWALVHPQRNNYIMQLPEGSNSRFACLRLLCLRFSAEAEDAGGAFEEEERTRWLEFTRRCTAKAKPQDKETLFGRAFQITCQDLISDWLDDGTEDELLVDLLIVKLLPSLRDEILSGLSFPLTATKIWLWYKVRSLIHRTLSAVARPTISSLRDSLAATENKLESKIRPVLSKLAKFKATAERKLNDLMRDKISSLLGEYVSPFLRPTVDAFDGPLRDGFSEGRDVFVQKVDVTALPDDKELRNGFLDAVPRTTGNIGELRKAADRFVKGLPDLSLPEVIMFDVNKVRQCAEDALLEMLDSAVYTVQVRLDEGEPRNNRLKEKIIRDYDHDVLLARRNCLKEAVRLVFLNSFKQLVGDCAQAAVDSLTEGLPEELRDFFNVKKLTEVFVDRSVGESIDSVVDAAVCH